MKGIILTAGYGTRFLPITKTIPKEMLPLGTRPALDYVVQEFIDSGIQDILIINSRRKKVLEDFFDREPELEEVFTRENKEANLKKVCPPAANFFFVRQQRMSGTGEAVMLARGFAGNDSCVLAYPDDIHFGETPLARQLMQVHEATGNSVLGLERRPEGEDISRYGVASPRAGTSPIIVDDLVEKPPPGTEASRFISIGRYLITPEIFTYLEEERMKHQGGEFYLTDAFRRLGSLGRLNGCVIEGERYDTGEPMGYYQALVRIVLRDEQVGAGFREFLKKELS